MRCEATSLRRSIEEPAIAIDDELRSLRITASYSRRRWSSFDELSSFTDEPERSSLNHVRRKERANFLSQSLSYNYLNTL